MEIHSHSHTDRKKWFHYLWEFLMLFLAVTLGFFVENQREHYIEHQREKEYAQSLYDDLKVDTAVIQRTSDEKAWIITKLDSVKNILSSNDISRYNEFIYYVERYISFNDIFTSQDITYQQLRSSGNFRYIRDLELAKKIAGYYNLYSRYQSVDGSFGYVDKNDMSAIEAKIFNPAQLLSLDNSDPSTFYDLALRPQGKFDPIGTDKQMLNLLYVKIANARTRNNLIHFLSWLKGGATEILNELKKDYNLE